MEVDVAEAAGRSVYRGQTFYFCAPRCKRMFDTSPGSYVAGRSDNVQPDAFDPVCGTRIQSINTAERCEHAGKTYYFCCIDCKQLFNTIPEMYED